MHGGRSVAAFQKMVLNENDTTLSGKQLRHTTLNFDHV
jgi:hypothetical protein